MQSGFGEMQQFMMDGSCPSSLFSPQPPTNPHEQQSNSPSSELNNNPHHKLIHHLPHPPPPGGPHFPQFGHPVPITQQLFHQSHPHHQFQLFHRRHQHQHQHQHHHLALDQDSGPENPNSPARMMRGPTSFLAAMNFKLGVNIESGGGGGDDDNGINLQGDDARSWQRDDVHEAQASIKQPFWRPLDIDYMNINNKRPLKDKQAAEISSNVKHFKKSDEVVSVSVSDHHQTVDGNYKLFSELEAIYKPGNGGGGGSGTNCNNQTGSGSALTGDDNPIMTVPAIGPTVENQPDNISDTSNGGVPAAPPQSKRQKRSKRRQEKTLASVATFFENLVKQLMDHQESLHRKFLEVMDKRDQGRSNREEAWRKQEAAKTNREAAARAQERALAAARESTIVSFIEKITGESLSLPTKPQQPQFDEESHDKQHDVTQEMNQNELVPYNADSKSPTVQMSSSRWPKAEVQALIRVRSGFETRFQEPGLKGPLWEEVSTTMATLGYQRSAKRCKEKWENINKYFRKAKDSGKKRPQHSKTCPYFHQLDQLYSKSSSNNTNPNDTRKDNNSELLDAIVVSNDQATAGKRNAEFNDEANNEEEEEDEDEDEDIGEEGQGESQEQARDRMNLNKDHNPQLQSNDDHYFRRVQS